MRDLIEIATVGQDHEVIYLFRYPQNDLPLPQQLVSNGHLTAMSKRVIFTCVVLLLLGLAGAYDMLTSITQQRVSLNPTALFIPAGIWLSLALPGARVLANIVFSLIYALLIMMLIASSLPHQRAFIYMGGVQMEQSPFVWVATFVAMVGSFFILLHAMLYTRPFEEHLNG